MGGSPGAVEREDKRAENKILGNTNTGKATRERTYKGERERGKCCVECGVLH